MEYTVLKLGRLAGISPRTLRYYDEIGLLAPKRVTSAGYRVYGQREVDALQQILYYRELGMGLEQIREILTAPAFDQLAALQGHLRELAQRRDRLDRLIQSVERTIRHQKGESSMTDAEKFEAFKGDLIRENEEKYGREIREKYGEEQVAASNARMMNMSREAYDAMRKLGEDITAGLEHAVQGGADPAGAEGLRLAGLHKEWLSFTWGQYSGEAHRALARMYVEDERFTAYYDGRVKGCAQFLCDAVAAFAGGQDS